MGVAVILMCALIWSVFGRVPVNVSTKGIYMTTNGIKILYSDKAGIISKVWVSDGDRVEKGDVIVSFSREIPEKKLEKILSREDKVEKVTMDSAWDVPDSDTKDLIDIKSELLTLKNSLKADEEMLAARQKQLDEQRQKTDTSLNEMQQARNMYFAFMSSNTDTLESIKFQDAQDGLRNAQSYYESAKSGLDSFNAQYDEKIDYYKNEIDKLKARQAGLSPDDAEYVSLQDQIDEYSAERESLKDQRAEYEDTLGKWEDRLKSAQSEYYNKAFAYIDAENAELHRQTFDNQLQDDYNIKLNNYNTELSALRSLENAVTELTVQISSGEAGAADRYEALKKQFDAAKGAILDEIEKEKEEVELEISKTEIKSSMAGYVLGMNVTEENAVTEGTAICTIAQNNVYALSAGAADELEIQADSPSGDEDGKDTMAALLYVGVKDGRKINEGMDVKVYPSTVNKQEYGHINAVVSNVGSYVTSPEEIKTRLGDDSLVDSFTGSGPVVQVICSLNTDPSTKSGYEWSSRKGASVELKPGTTVTADIVTEKKAPITMLIPFLKEKLTVRVKTGEKEAGS